MISHLTYKCQSKSKITIIDWTTIEESIAFDFLWRKLFRLTQRRRAQSKMQKWNGTSECTLHIRLSTQNANQFIMLFDDIIRSDIDSSRMRSNVRETREGARDKFMHENMF